MSLVASICVFVFIGRKAETDIELQQLNLSWETVFTADFELDMLRRKRPYKWTIWVSLFHSTRPHDHFSHGECSYTLECATLLYLFSSSSSSFRSVQAC